ncbi:coiled-coil domain-containing protein 149 isoform X1 [Chrysoperla carnea]|uniref:coiled-coil domain-containing protein 149 isoform X1 n=1 Tax=Chrysoperla carnea TaxID=189513 RepID=UPI001D086DC7|nr:coiled-coil domain-containing protein 149 isoform X1 [Chrysoperla carnea]
MEEYIENYVSENTALRSKLQAKTEALKILAKELDKCRTERDQFKLMAEQIQERYSCLKKKSCHINLYSDSGGGGNVAQLLGETRENNKLLKLELEATKQCLIESRGDIQVLRQQLQSKQKHGSLTNEDVFPIHQREELVEQLEKLSAKTIQMRADIQSLLDEKEELIKERDAFKHKAHRVSHELAIALRLTSQNNGDQDTNDTQFTSKPPAYLVDADALVSENRYLHERLQQADAETQLATQALAKYKNMLETKRRKGIIKLGTNNTDMIMSHKQVKQLLERGTMAELPVTSATIADLKSLCLGLLETLGDKTLALSHQKKANKILASRVSELESKLGKGSAFPSHILLENYSSAEADRQDVSDEFKFCKQIRSNSIELTTTNDVVEVNGADRITDEDEIEKLPPKLQEMVDQALQQLKIEL